MIGESIGGEDVVLLSRGREQEADGMPCAWLWVVLRRKERKRNRTGPGSAKGSMKADGLAKGAEKKIQTIFFRRGRQESNVVFWVFNGSNWGFATIRFCLEHWDDSEFEGGGCGFHLGL